MNFETFIGFVVTLIFGILTTYFIVTANIEKTITDKLNDPSFKKQIAEQVRIPFLIFDENETYLADDGASNLIKKIKVIKNREQISKVVLSLNKKTKVAPILICLNDNVPFFQGTPLKESDWEFRALQYNLVEVNASAAEKPPAKLFKVEIL